jgi:hypothetical protein
MKPQDLLLGIREIFAVFVPGAVLLYVGIVLNASKQGPQPTDLVHGADTLAFAALAYGLGSVAYAIGAGFDHIYDRCEDWFVAGRRRERLVQFEALASRAKDEAIAKVAGPESDLARLWSNKSFWVDHLRRTCPAASAELDRLEGTQKFFRTFSVVLIVIGLNLICRAQIVVSAVAFGTLLVCIGFYAFRRAEWNYRLLKWAFLSRM